MMDSVISSGGILNTTDGFPLHAHGASLIFPEMHPAGANGKYFLVGTSQKVRVHSAWLSKSINLYSSLDLQHWTFEAQIFNESQIMRTTSLQYRIERPKVLYCRRTRGYVMWFHLDDAAFSLGHVGVAKAESITGPFAFVSGWRPDGQRSLDLTLFQESDGGEAYLVRSVDNRFAGFSRLTDDYMNTTTDGIISRTPCRVEGLAVWRDAPNALYLLGSHLTGWHANPQMLFRSSNGNIVGAHWHDLGNPTKKGCEKLANRTCHERSVISPERLLSSSRSSLARILLLTSSPCPFQTRTTLSQHTWPQLRWATNGDYCYTWAIVGTRARRVAPVQSAEPHTCGCRSSIMQANQQASACRCSTANGTGLAVGELRIIWSLQGSVN